MLDRLSGIEMIADHDPRLNHIHFDWIDAGGRTQGTVRLLSEQLRRFLDDQVWLENRRVFDLLRSIEAQALSLRPERNPNLTMALEDIAVTVNLPFERPLYAPPRRVDLAPVAVEPGSGKGDQSSRRFSPSSAADSEKRRLDPA